jgi:hypothetical protein
VKNDAIVRDLEQAHVALGVRVRRERGAFRGGRCVVGEEEVLVLNRRHPPEAQLAILAESLRGLAVDQVFLRPAVRAALEEQWRRADEGLQADFGDGDGDG